ncbi:MAG: DNA alkylation repair protein [Candidatus Cloacimonetes bacterium]|nr:DNA alkylation repair protein [Candidatus Cloacimonadota bacterium]
MHQYLEPLIESFQQNSDPLKAKPMQKYMKNRFEFFGLKRPVRKELQKPFLQKDRLPAIEELPEIIKELWQWPQREFQYFAIDLLRKTSKRMNEESIGLFEYLIITKSWWDTVDIIAARTVGTHFNRFPELLDKYIDKWMKSDNMWLQRTSLLFQLHYKEKTDYELMKKLILKLNGSSEFFINKAIGWVLRQYSKTDAKAVITFVENNNLASLSEREALKWLKNQNSS